MLIEFCSMKCKTFCYKTACCCSCVHVTKLYEIIERLWKISKSVRTLFLACVAIGCQLFTQEMSNKQMAQLNTELKAAQLKWVFILLYCFLCFRHPTVLAKALCFWALRLPLSFIHFTGQFTTISYEYREQFRWGLTGNIHQPLLMTC